MYLSVIQQRGYGIFIENMLKYVGRIENIVDTESILLRKIFLNRKLRNIIHKTRHNYLRKKERRR